MCSFLLIEDSCASDATPGQAIMLQWQKRSSWQSVEWANYVMPGLHGGCSVKPKVKVTSIPSHSLLAEN